MDHVYMKMIRSRGTLFPGLPATNGGKMTVVKNVLSSKLKLSEVA